MRPLSKGVYTAFTDADACVRLLYLMASTILVIEDDAAIRRGVLDALKFTGHTTLEAADGEQGMKLALSATFDLILLDLVCWMGTLLARRVLPRILPRPGQ